MKAITHIASTLDLLKFTRRFGFFATMFITLQATAWCFEFPMQALDKGLGSGEIALIIGAVMMPITTLQGFVINAYFNRGTQNVITASQLQSGYTSSDSSTGYR